MELKDFESWISKMDETLERFRSSLPADAQARLDFSPASLDGVETLILSRFDGIAAAKDPSQAEVLDQFARYVGETFRRNLGGRWELRVDDPKYVFFGIPALTDFAPKSTPVCPRALVTASTDRRTGKFISTVFENCRKRYKP